MISPDSGGTHTPHMPDCSASPRQCRSLACAGKGHRSCSDGPETL